MAYPWPTRESSSKATTVRPARSEPSNLNVTVALPLASSGVSFVVAVTLSPLASVTGLARSRGP
ncbi:MAG: hypothetical protein LKF00_05795 [Olsenella sp.]|nr:hypothetical protein [Olsenella sp.]